jgi:ATP-binding cassette subfamily B protein RaxB
MMGLYAPTAGDVTIGGVDIRQYGLANYRSNFAAVTQEDQLFAGTVSDNISFFDPDIDHERVRQAASYACISREIESMPMGFNTYLGDMGLVLSGGQRQRILLARAIYKNPKILFLDEATSHLDVENERAINQMLSKLRITRLFVAHRPDTVASATRVVRLEQGRMVQDLRDVTNLGRSQEALPA